MPVVRDGSNRVTEYRVDPVGSPPGPVVRDRVSEARMADFAAERAAASRQTAPQRPQVPGHSIPAPKTRQPSPSRTQKRLERAERYLAAIRASTSHREAAEALGIHKHALEMFVSDLRRRRELPADVEELLRQRNPARKGATAPRRPAHVESQDPEAGAPATAADDRGPTEARPSATEVAMPPGPPLLDGEDRCLFVRWLGSTMLAVCDRAEHGPDGHRGRLIRIGLTDAKVLGHLAVAS